MCEKQILQMLSFLSYRRPTCTRLQSYSPFNIHNDISKLCTVLYERNKVFLILANLIIDERRYVIYRQKTS